MRSTGTAFTRLSTSRERQTILLNKVSSFTGSVRVIQRQVLADRELPHSGSYTVSVSSLVKIPLLAELVERVAGRPSDF